MPAMTTRPSSPLRPRPRAVVTGGSSGIGLATAALLAGRGWDVDLVARDPGRLDAARRRAEAAATDRSQRIRTASVDLSDEDRTRSAFEELMAEVGAPDALVNSAGIVVPGDFLNLSPEAFRANLDHGFWSVVHPCRAVAPRMVERGGGAIVNVSSAAGFFGIWGYSGYAASKHAVLGFSETLRAELKPHGVRVSVVCPPDTETPGLKAERKVRPPETEAISGALKPISAERVARSIARAIDTGRYLVIPDLPTRLMFRLKSLALEVFLGAVDRDAARVRARGSRVP